LSPKKVLFSILLQEFLKTLRSFSEAGVTSKCSGKGQILEIPISAFGFPYIGTFMRISPVIFLLTRKLLNLETKLSGRPFVFLTHPNEFIDELFTEKKINKRSNSFFSHLMGDVIRRQLKLKNLGKKAIPLYRKEIEYFKKKGFDFISCSEYLLKFNSI